MNAFVQFVMAKNPKMSAAQKAELQNFVQSKQIEQFAKAGVDPKDIPTDSVQQAVMLQQLGSQTYKPKAKKEFEDKVIQAAQGMINTIKDKSLKGEERAMAIENYASQMAAAKGFAEGGKVLSGAELGILAGQIPIMQKRVPNVWEKFTSNFTGRLPGVTSVPQDTESQLLYKAQQLQNQFGGQTQPQTTVQSVSTVKKPHKIIEVK